MCVGPEQTGWKVQDQTDICFDQHWGQAQITEWWWELLAREAAAVAPELDRSPDLLSLVTLPFAFKAGNADQAQLHSAGRPSTES